MGHTIHLLYFEGCPNVDQARNNLREALSKAGQSPQWKEVNIQAEGAPKGWRGFPSPTVLVNGADVSTGATSAESGGACRFGGAPGVEVILRSLRRHPKAWLALTSLPAAGFAFLPVFSCGACYPAFVGLLSALGLGSILAGPLFKPVMVGFLALALFGFLYQAIRTNRYGPLGLGFVGAGGLYTATFMINSVEIKVISIALLVGASIWNVVPMFWKRNGGKNCPSCRIQEGGEEHA